MRKLKWLNGPLAGLEFELPDGQVHIGGADADIALPLDEGGQAVLTIGNDGVVASHGVSVWVDGLPWDVEKALPFYRAIDLAGLAFVLGVVDDALESMPVPTRRCTPTQDRRMKWISTGAAISIGVVLFGLGLSLWQPPVSDRIDLDTWLTRELNKPPLRHLHVKRAADGSFVVSGKCAFSKDVDRLRMLLAEKGGVIHDESRCADALRESVCNILALYGYRDADVSIDENVECAQIRGQIVDDVSWQRVASQLRTLAGLRSWHVVNDRALWFDRLYDALMDRGSLDDVSISMAGKTLTVSGAVGTHREQAIADVIAQFNRSNKDGFVATWHNIPSLQKTTRWLPAPVVSVGGGNANSTYVTLANGMRLQPGCVLPNGFVVVKLTRRSMSLRKEQRVVSIPLNV
jgi:type III secretion protein D